MRCQQLVPRPAAGAIEAVLTRSDAVSSVSDWRKINLFDSSGRRWLVSGVSSGLGQALLELVASRGDVVIGTVRKNADRERLAALGPNVVPLHVDLVDPASMIEAEARRAIDSVGGLDVLVNNAGYGLVGAVEESSEDEARHQMETNFWGAWKLLRAALPALRASSRARIINVSSVAGFSGVPGMGLYNASKFALEGLSAALRLELAGFGIGVTIVEPGALRTDWAGTGLKKSVNEMPDYAGSTGQMRSRVSAMSGQQSGDPRRAAAAIVQLVEASEPPLRLPLGNDAVKMARRVLAATSTELDTWMDLSESIGFDESTP
jgi:NAD(P)-dependent dehydrogenase (short-subunit alcohol dehydrogenase family)